VKDLRLGLLLQLAVSTALLVLLARRVPFGDLAEAFGRVQPHTLLAALALILVGYWGRARRWSVLLSRSGVALGSAASYGLTLVGTFYGIFTPGRVGEFARALHLREGAGVRSVPSMVWDRVADVVLLELLCLPGFALVPAWHGHLQLVGLFVAIVLATALGIAILAQDEVADAAVRLLPFLRRPAARWRESSRGVLSGAAFRMSLVWGLFFYLFMYAAAWLLLHDLAPRASATLLLGLPVIPLLGNLPIAFGGLGLREQVSATVFGGVGAGEATGAAFSLLLFATATLLPGLLGVSGSLLMRLGARGARP
jgi:uncharacterized membrane protein YbhN (UPF0104 family)